MPESAPLTLHDALTKKRSEWTATNYAIPTALIGDYKDYVADIMEVRQSVPELADATDGELYILWEDFSDAEAAAGFLDPTPGMLNLFRGYLLAVASGEDLSDTCSWTWHPQKAQYRARAHTPALD